MAQPVHPWLTEASGLEPPPSRPVLRACATPQLGAHSLIVIPTYDERSNLAALVAAVLAVAPLAHVLIVDDASPDGTGELADALAERDGRVHVLHRPGKLGLGTAYLRGFAWGLRRDFQRFFEMDADFSHDPVQLERLFDALDAGAELAVGSRNVRGGSIAGWGIGRRVLSKGGSAYSRVVLGVDVKDLTTGYKAFTRRALEALELDAVRSNGYAFQIEMTYRALRAGLKVVEVPISFVDRRVGQSKMDSTIFAEAVQIPWRLKLDAMLKRL